MIQVQIKKIHDDAHAPSRNSAGDAGYDLYAIGHDVIKAGERQLVPTGISISIPHGYYGRVAPRSGLALRDGMDVLAGVIDNDYRGNVGVILINFGDERVDILKGSRIAQLIVEEYRAANITVVNSLQDTVRGTGGFGSTGN